MKCNSRNLFTFSVDAVYRWQSAFFIIEFVASSRSEDDAIDVSSMVRQIQAHVTEISRKSVFEKSSSATIVVKGQFYLWNWSIKNVLGKRKYAKVAIRTSWNSLCGMGQRWTLSNFIQFIHSTNTNSNEKLPTWRLVGVSDAYCFVIYYSKFAEDFKSIAFKVTFLQDYLLKTRCIQDAIFDWR